MIYTEKELIIFDFDGTLINSVPDLTAAANKMLSKYKLTPLTVNEVTPFIGNGARALVKKALEYKLQKNNCSNEFLEEALAIYFSAYSATECEGTCFYPGVLDTLSYLRERGYKMAICTNKPYDFIEPILDKLSVKELFIDWIGEDSLGQKKPHALPLLHLVNRANSSLSKSIMIGDSKNDIIAAQNAGMESIGVSYGYNYYENIRESNPTTVIDTFTELKTLF